MAVYHLNYYDENGKRRGKTFTGSTKTEAAAKAELWKLLRPKTTGPSMTVLEAVEAYIQKLEAVLSPSTIRSYERMKKANIENDEIGNIRLCDLSQEQVQAWISRLYLGGRSPKTVSNNFGLLSPAIRAKMKNFDFSEIILPQKQKYIGHTPSDEEVQTVLEYARNRKEKDLYRAILLAAFGPLRRSEVCALTSDDVKGNNITINKDMVQNKFDGWEIRTTKTYESTRTIEYPQFVIDELKGIKGSLVNYNPEQIHHQFRSAIKATGVQPFRFHDLRHYGASIMHSIGVPDVYIKQRGGWTTDHVMKRIYINAIDEEKRKQTDKINEHFSSLNAKSEVRSEVKVE